MIQTLLLFPFLVVYSLIGLFCIRLAWKHTRGIRIVVGVTLLFFPGMLVIDMVPGYLLLQYLCLTDGGEVVFKPVKPDGYVRVNTLGSGPYSCESVEELISGKLKFTEVETTEKHAYLIKEPGKYRCTLERRGSPLCSRFEASWSEWQKRLWWTGPGFTRAGIQNGSQYCLGIEKITTFKSRYIWISERPPQWMSDWLGIHYYGSDRIVDSHTGEILAQRLMPMYYGGWFHRFFWDDPASGPPAWKCSKTKYASTNDMLEWINKAFSRN